MQNFLLSLICLLLSGSFTAQLTRHVTAIPPETPAEDAVYVSGSFDGWTGGAPEYQLTEVTSGEWEITLDPTPGVLEFKFTRGDWSTVEGNENGGFLPNRTLTYTGEALTEDLTILSWEDLGGTNSTAASNVTIIDTEFYIPQLDRTRRIWVYLPPDYDTTEEHYKVLYMHDGQNVFDSATSFAGEWEVDETLNELFEAGDPGCIAVAIDNGGTHRIDEYSPWENENYGGGEGDLYLQFITETLKPYIDEEYRTLPEREWTGIMGSSMGGLISTYGGIEYSDVFSRIGAFSPSYWFSEESFAHLETTPHEGSMRIYTLVGSGEGSGMTEGVETMELTYEGAGYDSAEHHAIEHEDGQHSEWYWAREFAAAYLWLRTGSPASVADTGTGGYGLRIWPNPVADTVHIECTQPERVPKMEVTDLTGKVLFTASQYQNEISVGQRKSGAVLLRIHLNTGQVVTRRVLLRC